MFCQMSYPRLEGLMFNQDERNQNNLTKKLFQVVASSFSRSACVIIIIRIKMIIDLKMMMTADLFDCFVVNLVVSNENRHVVGKFFSAIMYVCVSFRASLITCTAAESH